MRILAVNDDPVFLSILGPMLQSLNQDEVTLAMSASDALAEMQASNATFDCVLLDIQMPGMNGIELCHRIRQMENYQRTPIVMITSLSDRRSIDDAFAMGATDYVNKPIDRTDLKARLGMVERLLTERRIAAAFEKQLVEQTAMAIPEVEFEAPILIPGFDRGIEYLALENYLLTIGNKRIHATSAVAISVLNASSFYRKSSTANFLNMLGDVAAALSDAFKTSQMLISYAGQGTFVCVSTGSAVPDLNDLEEMIQMGVEEFGHIYAMDNLPLPRIKVGQVVRSSFFGLFNPTSILDRALLAAVEPAPKPNSWWNAA